MATAVKVKTVGAKKPLKPKARPDTLTPRDTINDAVAVPDLPDQKASSVHKWAEELRDNYQEHGELLTLKGLREHATQGIPDEETAKTVRIVLKNIYGQAGTDGASTPARPSGKKKEGKRAAANGKAKAKAADREDSDSVPVKFNNKTKIAYTWVRSPSSDRQRVVVFPEGAKLPLRAMFRYLGKKGWDTDEVMGLMKKMGLEKYHEELRKKVGAHVAAGRAGAEGYEFDDLSKGERQLIESYRK